MNAPPDFAPAYDPSFPSYDEVAGSSSSSSSTSSLWIRALLIIILLALIGFNVFTYLDDITQWFGDTFGAPFQSVARFLGYAATDAVKTTADVTAKGAKSAVDIAAGAATSGIDVLQKTIGGEGNQGKQGNQGNQGNQGKPDNNDNNATNANHANNQVIQYTNTNNLKKSDAELSLENALSHAKKEPPQPDDATSRTQRTGKSGYCYIGEDRGFRSCIQVGEQDTCMSGDIFPTHAICVNPRLRQ